LVERIPATVRCLKSGVPNKKGDSSSGSLRKEERQTYSLKEAEGKRAVGRFTKKSEIALKSGGERHGIGVEQGGQNRGGKKKIDRQRTGGPGGE